jgi:hypothetical protein
MFTYLFKFYNNIKFFHMTMVIFSVLLYWFLCSMFNILKKSSCIRPPQKSRATLHWTIKKLDQYKNLGNVLFWYSCRNADNIQCKHDFLFQNLTHNNISWGHCEKLTVNKGNLIWKIHARDPGILIGKNSEFQPSLFSSFFQKVSLWTYTEFIHDKNYCL